MARKNSEKKVKTQEKKPKRTPRTPKEDATDILIGLSLLLLAGFITISLVSFNARATIEDPLNWGGMLGYLVARFFYSWLGVMAYLLPFLLLLWGFNRLLRRPAKKLVLNTLILTGFAFFVEVTLGFFHHVHLFPLRSPSGRILESMSLAGKIGTYVFNYMVALVGKAGLIIILVFLFLVSMVVIMDINLHKLTVRLVEKVKDAVARYRAEKEGLAAERQREPGPQMQAREELYPEEIDEEEEETEEFQAHTGFEGKIPAEQRVVRHYVPELPHEELALAELLDQIPADWQSVPDKEAREGAKLLVKRLEEFGVTGTVGDIIPGPVITRYEFHPAPGVKISKIMGLADDLSLALKADRIRILPIPGKSAVGIEIPNHMRKAVPLRLVVGSGDFKNSPSPLTLALGTSITGNPEIADLASIPHLLIAGTTGSGKSVCIHSILSSILIKAGPEKVRFMAIDPKRLELPAYNPIPHLIQPTIVDPRKATQSLEFVVKIMEERYKEFSRVGARDITGYNAQAKKPKPYIVVVVDELADLMLTAPAEIEQRIIRLAQMARAVGIHLVLATQRPSVDVITGLIKANFPGRIAFQVASKTDSRTILDMNGAEALLGRGDMLFLPPGKGEPVRLHGSFVSTGEANRIVGKLAEVRLKSLFSTLTDEERGEELAEAVLAADLLDPLLDPFESLYETKRKRLAEIISPELLHEVEGHYYPPMEELAPIREQMEQQTSLEETDEFFVEAARLVMRHKEASVSMLQRRLNVGWARAGRIIDQLEQAGIVGPYEGSKSRKVLVNDEESLEALLKDIEKR